MLQNTIIFILIQINILFCAKEQTSITFKKVIYGLDELTLLIKELKLIKEEDPSSLKNSKEYKILILIKDFFQAILDLERYFTFDSIFSHCEMNYVARNIFYSMFILKEDEFPNFDNILMFIERFRMILSEKISESHYLSLKFGFLFNNVNVLIKRCKKGPKKEIISLKNSYINDIKKNLNKDDPITFFDKIKKDSFNKFKESFESIEALFPEEKEISHFNDINFRKSNIFFILSAVVLIFGVSFFYFNK